MTYFTQISNSIRLILLITLFLIPIIQCSSTEIVEDPFTGGKISGRVYESPTLELVSDCEILIDLFHINGLDTFPLMPRPDTVLTDTNGFYNYHWGWLGDEGGKMITDLVAKKINYEELDTTVTISIIGSRQDNDVDVNLYLKRIP